MERLEKYEDLQEIGQGGMSVVYRGRDAALDRVVAIKVMHKHLARDPDARERFSREAKAVARLTHHNIPEIYDFSATDDDQNFLVSEFVDGAPLSDLIRRGPMLPEIGVIICVAVADALSHAHEHKIIHRDVKPENILVGSDGVAKLTDFGIAQIVGLESMTITGTLVGSPAHMAPEQIEGVASLDARADVWAMGTVLYVVTTGTLPFDATTPHGVLKRIMEGRYEDPRRHNPHIDSELARIISRCLQVDRHARYQTMADLAAELREWLADRGVKDPEDEVAAWMKDPRAATEDLSARLVRSLMLTSERDLAQGQRHKALEKYNRVLTLDPDNEDAFERVRQLTTGIRWRRRLVALAAVVVAAGVGVAGWWFWPTDTAGPVHVPEVAVVVPEADVVEAPDVPPVAPEGLESGALAGATLASVAALDMSLVQERREARANAGRLFGRVLGGLEEETVADLARRPVVRVRKNGGDKPPEVVKTVPVKVSVYPPAVQLVVDDQPVRAGAVVELALGQHVAVLTHSACARCEPYRRKFTVGETTTRKHFTFPFPPMSLDVTCPDGAKLYVDGELLGGCGKRLVKVDSPETKNVVVQVVTSAGTKKRRVRWGPGGYLRWKVE